MSTPLLDQQPPPVEVTQQAYTAHSGHGSVGPVIGVLAVITILGVIAGMIGRLCSGRPIMGHGGQYDFEGWVEKKCSSCIDGRVEPPRIRHDIPVAEPVLEEAAPQEIKEEEEEEEEAAAAAAQKKSHGKQAASSDS
ncbi:hypothetical protein JRO89_XS02G0060700 [Xanthoceras sorbifolium]|uniref:Uncharacterized protein n=1 Tax=Xanthoceras sorbifolium TaxID=99658 RepID=A0ABQ8IEW8_9ROSI|nr:hypothetical protein JRO89_XS02G0060700 [Xanthoceras sorbifolium]